jgi:hypothetical protein
VEAKVSIKQNWQDLVELATTNENDNFDEFNELKIKSSNQFEKLYDEDYASTLVENIINVEHIIDNDETSLTIAPIKGFQPFGLFRNKYYEKKTFQ